MDRLRHSVTLLATLVTTACGPSGGAPVFDPIPSNQTAFVASEYTLEVRVSGGGGDVDFSFSADIDISDRAQINEYGDGSTAIFRWTPNASDVGVHLIDLTASGGGGSSTETISIEVRPSVDAANAPIFRQPLGTGTTLDLSVKPCIDLEIVVEDPDNANVEIAQEEPVIAGATLEQASGLTATWTWCPSQDQIEADDRYGLTLSASDGENPKTIKNYLIVIRKEPLPDCPGSGPVISHVPVDESTLVGLTVIADISDDVGLKSAPLFYYSTTPPATPPDLGAMTMTTMILLDGDNQNGTWGADVPNPVVDGAAGSSAAIHYVIVAQDNDDEMGDCDHMTQAPESGAYEMTVTNPGGSGGLALCETCTADVQCGDSGDNCVRMGTMGDAFCGSACDDDADCPTDYYCSVTMLNSVDMVMARQCIPDDYTCTDPPPSTTCSDDSYEPNDTRPGAYPGLAPGIYDLTSCPDGSFADDEDWFQITLSGDAQVTVEIDGGSATDLDLAITNATGTVIVSSTSFASTEMVTSCLGAGTYYIRVYAYGTGENDYVLSYERTTMSCGGSTSCVDDAEEPDDNYMSSRRVDYDVPHTSTTNAICADDDDWFRVYMFAGETLHVTLEFTQSSADEDLDLHLYQGTTDLTPCSPSMPGSCMDTNGQGSNSNENAQYAITSSGYYYVVVRGWDGAENLYDICIGLNSTDCPALP